MQRILKHARINREATVANIQLAVRISDDRIISNQQNNYYTLQCVGCDKQPLDVSHASRVFLSFLGIATTEKEKSEPFDRINAIDFEDSLQLPPIREAQAFHQIKRFVPETHLWRLFSLVELTENMRHQGDSTFSDLLKALRVCELKA
ncbi:ATP-dependent DNA helicase [Trichonephila inaurata madagascariensis]|uniref:ATP-dependent DNA helicase n=1 Tax=Trichonephila inaurata madagascariensis TaxID=2747483 RepID=A0A8X6YDE3_9ARAC|nr:ATP-dependent DNA helicase [Trichonephila inaurata madagascariensis]